MARNKIKLLFLARFPNMRALTWHNDFLYASKGYSLFKIGSTKLSSVISSSDWEKVATFKPDWLRNIGANFRLTTRLLRAGFHSLEVLPSGRMIAVLAKSIAVLNPDESEFKETWHVQRGTRPMGIVVTPGEKIFWGEYFDNRNRDEVHVYGSEDRGNTWDVVYTFPKGSIRHIHDIVYDPYGRCLWVLTGDEGHEPKILKASKDWKTVDVIMEGTQQARAATMIVCEDFIYFATDTPYEQNHIYRMERATRKIEQVAEISGPSMWSCKVGNTMFFSSAAEPGKFYHPAACIYGSADGVAWEKLLEWPKDRLHPKYFQFGNIILPKGENPSNFLIATGAAVKNEDLCLNLWSIESNE